jgi:hypothetical protein
MGKQELDNLVRIDKLKIEPPSRKEFDGMLASARRSLIDAQNESLGRDSQFILAYGAAHQFALIALRNLGYRSNDRTTVFQALPHTIGTSNADLQIFSKAHNARNLAEYRGQANVDEKFLAELIVCTKRLEAAITALTPPSA